MPQNYNATKPESGVTTFGQLYGILRDHFEAVASSFSGTSFPADPTDGRPCWRTDRGENGLLYIYTGNPDIGESGWVEVATVASIGVEVIAARGSKASLDERLDVVLNEDGTLKASVEAYQSQWVNPGFAPTYVSATQFSVTGDQTDIYLPTRRIKANLTAGAVYSEVESASYDAVGDTTTVTLLDAVLDSTVTSVEHSIISPSANNGAVTAKMVGTQEVDILNVFRR